MKHLIPSSLLLTLSLVACAEQPAKEDVCDCDWKGATELCEDYFDKCESDKDCKLQDEADDLNDLCDFSPENTCACPESSGFAQVCEQALEACAEAGSRRDRKRCFETLDEYSQDSCRASSGDAP